MVTYSCRCPRGSSELGEQRGEIAAREGPLERLRRVDIVFLEAKKPLADGTLDELFGITHRARAES
ncbi:MAG TPA: hypothetical protein VI585_27640 [Candidatus Binatia bacterium]